MLATYGVFDRQDFSDWFGFSYANGLQVRPWNATVPMLPPMAEPLCMLTFSAGVLDSVGWYDDGQ
jgi:hypothetical protein